MPKRPNPFGDSSPLQFKNRVGTKEVDLGVCAGEKMQTVYDKTKAMMFEGARRPVPQSTGLQLNCTDHETVVQLPGQLRIDAEGALCAQPDQPMETQPVETFSVKKPIHAFFNNNNYSHPLAQIKNGQLQINASGQLTAGVRAKPCGFQGVCLQPTQCSSCTRFSNTLHGCSFCEKRTCATCMRSCDQCQGSFCHVCSVINYDDCSERAFCLHCSP